MSNAAQKVDDGVVNIHGKAYKTVARRIADFREKHPEWSITCKVMAAADLVQIKAVIKNEAGKTLATGLAEEVRGSTNINKTSALENAETSAVGRALAFLGYGGTEIASADEVANAITQQKELEAVERLKAHNAALRDNIESVTAIKAHLANDEYNNAYEAIHELKDEAPGAWEALWIATSAGGVWTTEERKQLKSNEMTAAKNDYHNGVEQ